MLTLLLCCLVINEIAHAPSDPRAEYVELLHTGSSRLVLSGATIYDERTIPRPIAERPLQMEPGDYLVLVRDGDVFSRSFPGVPFLQVAGWPSLNNTGDRVAIAVDGMELDAVAYDADWGHGPASLERVDPSGPSNHRINWRPSLSTGTPGQRNSRFAPDTTPPNLIYAEVFHPDSALVVFSEPVIPTEAAAFDGGSILWQTDSSAVVVRSPWMADWEASNPPPFVARVIRDLFGNLASSTSVEAARPPSPGDLLVSERLVRPVADPFDGVPNEVRFLELWNRSGALLSVRGLTLSGPESDSGERASGTVPFVPRPVASGSTLVLAEDLAAAWAAFSLNPSVDVRAMAGSVLRADQLQLVGRGGALLDEATYAADWFDPVLGERGFALSRVADDGMTPLAWTGAEPTPGRHSAWTPSERAISGSVVFSEVLFHALSGQSEFVELLVRRSADLNGLHLIIDRAPAPPDSVRVVYRPTPVPAGTMVTALFSVTGVTAADLPGRFRLSYPDAGGLLIPLAGSPSLRNDGVTMELRSGHGELLDRVSLTPAQHAPDLASVAGVSLERVDPDGNSGETTNWVSARAPELATPGLPFSGTSETGPEEPHLKALDARPRVFDPREGPVAILLRTPGQSAVQVHIYTRSGHRIRSLLLRSNGDRGRVYWDGRDESGRLVRAGIYVVFSRDSDGVPHRIPVVVASR